MMKMKVSPIANTFITPWLWQKICIFISTLHSLPDKFSVSIRFVNASVISLSRISVESFMLFFTLDVQRFYKIRTCYSNFTVRNFSGVLHALLPKFWESFYKNQWDNCSFIKKETLAQAFSCEFCEISKDTFLTEHLRWLLLDRQILKTAYFAPTGWLLSDYLFKKILIIKW